MSSRFLGLLQGNHLPAGAWCGPEQEVAGAAAPCVWRCEVCDHIAAALSNALNVF